MRRVGDDIYIQRGETWSLDFEVVTEKGHPFMCLKTWQNPYLVITVSAALYEQKGDFRESYWLDLSKRWIEKADGSMELEDTKKFISTVPLYVDAFDIADIMSKYGNAAGGKIVTDTESDFDITNFLFYTDPDADGNNIYKYITSYSGNTAVWKEYNFRVVKQFDTKSWMEQGYLYDAKILSGESLIELISATLKKEGTAFSSNTWSDHETQSYINLIQDEEIRLEAQKLFDAGIPLRSTYDTKLLIIEPSRLYVSVNIQGGVG